MRADFYRLGSTPLEQVLTRICERVLADGERLLIVGPQPLLDRLDAQLWSYSREGFLPHGEPEDRLAKRQPILLAAEVTRANSAQNVLLADGEWREAALDFRRLFYMFDEARIEEARRSWISLKDRADVERHFWKQDDRDRWVEGP